MTRTSWVMGDALEVLSRFQLTLLNMLWESHTLLPAFDRIQPGKIR